MYNGIGLQTARGSGTNGYVQANLSSVLLSRKRVEYNAEADLKRMEAEINRKPNEELLQHARKRHIEMKCAEFEILMEEKGFDDDEIEKKVSDYRNLLLSQLESGELNVDDELDIKNSHAKMQYAKKGRDRFRDALGLAKDYVAGSSMEKMNKTDVVGAAMEPAPPLDEKAKMLATLKEMKNKEKKKKAKKASKKRKRKESSSSSSSDSSDSDSDSSSSDSSSSDSSEVEKKKKRKKAKKQALKEPKKEVEEPRSRKEEVEKSRERNRSPDNRRRDERDDRRERDRRRERSPRESRRSPRREERRRHDSRSRSPRRRPRHDSASPEPRGRKEPKEEPLSETDDRGHSKSPVRRQSYSSEDSDRDRRTVKSIVHKK